MPKGGNSHIANGYGELTGCFFNRQAWESIPRPFFCTLGACERIWG